MEVIRLNFIVVLKHVLRTHSKPLKKFALSRKHDFNAKIQDNHDYLYDDCFKNDNLNQESRLDLSGPALIEGVKFRPLLNLLAFLNWNDQPFYITLLYKVFIYIYFSYRIGMTTINYLKFNLIADPNPIYLLTGILFTLSSSIQICNGIYVTTMKFKKIDLVLGQQKLCFLKKEFLETLGTSIKNLFAFIIIIQSIVIALASKQNSEQFFSETHLVSFTLDFISVLVSSLWVFGLGGMELYIRCSFGHWLLALKDHLEKQFFYLRQLELQKAVTTTIKNPEQSIPSNSMQIITLDQIQRCLNNMDDQLEIIRDINYIGLITCSLNCFLGIGFWLLTAYNQIHNLNDYYHGLSNIGLALNYQLLIFLSYFGDSWLHYCVKSLISCIEDEYFLQNGHLNEKKKNKNKNKDMLNHESILPINNIGFAHNESGLTSCDNYNNHNNLQLLDDKLEKQQQFVSNELKSRKKHVLFFIEFQEQFSNHLGTSYSNLTFGTNIHILRAFVTLIAAQIVFDHEH